MDTPHRTRIHIRGLVQGVGFRPWIYRLARERGLSGWVANTRGGVEIELSCSEPERAEFLDALSTPPPLARIDEATISLRPADKTPYYPDFAIRESEDDAVSTVASVTPDAALCSDCLREMFDETNRRYRYPFITCTHCGPRFTIATDIPYDRVNTTMDAFPMCPKCRTEYENPDDRRYHAQPIACWDCGPTAVLRNQDETEVDCSDPIRETVSILETGGIVAIKGLGGYHLACDARNPAACRELRRRKHREDKPFAVMTRDIVEARRHVRMTDESESLLHSSRAPIVILPRAVEYDLPQDVAPSTGTLGVMLPYTPLHHILFEDAEYTALVMTSGNVGDEPIAYTDEAAFEQLGTIADAFLTHDRPIHMRTDDSVVRCEGATTILSRRSRGYAPEPIKLVEPITAPVLACGAHLKHTFCLGTGDRAFMSHHIGDLENEATWHSFMSGVEHFQRLFSIDPTLVAHDLHPDYLSTQYAERTGLPIVGVQHHHAHIASCLADNGCNDTVLGLAFDGMGLGDDGTIWGGEWLLADTRTYRRVGRLAHLVLPGGDMAVRNPWRIGAAVLDSLYGRDWHGWSLPINRSFDEAAWRMLESSGGVSSWPRTSAMGRLFDAVSAIAGVRGTINYEGQAAIELEQVAERNASGAYQFAVILDDGMSVLDWRPAIRDLVRDLRNGAQPGVVSTRFHRGLADAAASLTFDIATKNGLSSVALSGGVFQNALLLGLLSDRLVANGLNVLTHSHIPPNDGGISLGQVVIAAQTLNKPHEV
jgi:hydrogenase maturation protein HypF